MAIIHLVDPTNDDQINSQWTGQSGIGRVKLVDAAIGVAWDYLDVQQTSATVETYVFKTGGSGGTTVRTIVVTYTSAAKTDLDTVAIS